MIEGLEGLAVAGVLHKIGKTRNSNTRTFRVASCGVLSTATRGGQDRNRQEGAKEVVEYRGKVADRCVSQD